MPNRVGTFSFKASGRIELTIRNLYDGLPVRRGADSRIVGNRIGLPGPGHGREMTKAPAGSVVNDFHEGVLLILCPNGATCDSLGQRPRSSNRNRRSPNGAICDRIYVAPLGL